MKNLILIFITVWLFNCTQGKYYPGVYNTTVFGKVNNSQLHNGVFILVIKYQYSFIESENGLLTYPEATIVFPTEDGSFNIEYENNTKEQDVYFLSKNLDTIKIHSQRRIGVGKEEFQIDMQKSTDWKKHYYFYVKPLLSFYLSDERFFIKDQFAKLYLNKWILEVETDFNQ